MTAIEAPFMDMDPLTMSAIVEMQLEDSQELVSNARGKQREGTVTDAQLALQMYMDDLRSCDEFLKDFKMAQSIAIAVQRDGELIHEAYRREEQIARDREYAERWAGRTGEDPATGPPQKRHRGQGTDSVPDSWTDPEILAKAAAKYMRLPRLPVLLTAKHSADSDDDETVAESSAWAASRENDPPVYRTCVACSEDKESFDIARLACGHEYCGTCLEELFRASMRDETLFPPRCDNQEIPVVSVSFFLTTDLVKDFTGKYEELSTKNRTYCHDRSCSTFIPTSSSDEFGTCPRCSRTTCTTCKSPSHSGDCPEDSALQQLLETASDRQWQRCYQCSRLVELDTGCNHMTCPCSAQFCYVCGAPWHTCSCPQWDERRLVERAAQIVDRLPQRRLFQPERVSHRQPLPAPLAVAVAGPSTLERSSSSSRQTAASAWESDFSDHSEWEQDWQDNSDERSEVSLGLAEAELHQVPGAPTVEPRETIDAPSAQDTADRLRRDRIAATIEHLRENHACAHNKWRYVGGRHACEECHHVLKEYIFECRQCQLQACNRCRRNRL